MHLLQLSDSGELSLTTHDNDKLPPYAILSHTWGHDGDEVTFDDVKRRPEEAKSKPGYAKIVFCAQQAKEEDLKHFWIDTCCIDKPNHTELSEAINSMFRWYQQATTCFVYLQDVSALKRDSDGQKRDWEASFRRSRWFTRGWTLQELLAPKAVQFWSRDAHCLGTKDDLKDIIHEITGIPIEALLSARLFKFSTAERLRWAAERETKKPEDKAYCLFGIFDVFLPPIYGEGDNAFARLQKEIEKVPRCQTNREITPQDRRQELLASLRFDQMDSRHTTIKDAQRTTCEWILQHPAYTAWNDMLTSSAQQRILWIAGKPGAGKSTMMKYALARAKKEKVDNEIVLHFFFNARGDDLEKTTLGMYRALLVQLFEAAPGLQSILDSVTSPTWTLSVLQNLLSTAVGEPGRRHLKIFIDALDECDEGEVREMVDYLEDLGECNLDDESRLNICFASRHYPTIEIRNGWRLVLEDEAGHGDDLKKYIQRRLQAGKGKLVDDIREQVQEKANGVFMWVVLVVDILNEEFRRGRIFAVKQRLREIPSGLSNLFKDLLRRDCVNMDDLLLCLQWILFARRPLQREEFYFAMVSGLHHESNNGVEWKPDPWNPEEVTAEDMKRFVLNSSKGLAELTKSKSSPTVQFIHESVRDFLLKDGGLHELWPDFEGRLVGLSHDRLKTCCADHLAADLAVYVSITQQLPKASSGEAKEIRQRVSHQFPFLEYATTEIFYHANEAALSIDQEEFLNGFALDAWRNVNNLYERAEIRRYGPSVSLLYIFAVQNHPRLMEARRCEDPWLRLPSERYQFPAIAAFAHGNHDALKVLLGDAEATTINSIVKDPEFGKPSQLGKSCDVLRWLFEKANWSFATYLLRHHVGKEIFKKVSSYRRLGDIISIAAQHGAMTFLQLLVDHGTDLHSSMALRRMSSAGCAQGVKSLLDVGACVDPRARDDDIRLALQAAARAGHEDIVEMLLNAGADVNAISDPSNALAEASSGGHMHIVKMLLAAGADVNANPLLLMWASFAGHEDIVEMLLNAGADVNAGSKRHDLLNALAKASSGGHKHIVKMLLAAGADVNANPLLLASRAGHEDIVEMLLNAGAGVNAISKRHDLSDALAKASSGGHMHIVKMLLAAGAKSGSCPRLR